MIKSILLTGAGPRGFVGRNLAEAFNKKYTLYTPDSKELDLCDYEATARYIDKHKINTIIHASSSIKDTLNSDLKMYFNLEKLSRDMDKMVYFGSGAEFDKRFDIVMASEDDIGKRIPVDGYGFAKYIMTTHARLSKNVYCLRLFGIFGKYEDWTYKFISNICCKAVYNLPLTIRRECKFDYIYIDDLPNVLEWFLEYKPKYHDYNFTYGSPVLLTELAEMTLQASEKKLEVIMLNPNGLNNEYTSSNERLINEVSLFKPTRLDIAVEKLYKYYVDNKDSIDYKILEQTK
jgi:UDP-glucose 4-epimerase